MTLDRFSPWLVISLATFTLCGCFGGTIAQQLARSIMLHGTDKVTASALEAKERNDKLTAQQMPFKDTPPDPYQLAFINSAFDTIKPQVEPLPTLQEVEEDQPVQIIRETRLVQVEVWNTLVGDEKNRILEKARLRGSSEIPPKSEWQQWQIAVGAESANTANKNTPETIIFLVPPEIGKMRSGTKALVELSSLGDLNVARYSSN